jgi:glucose-1-phosphate thymidylyltransferase
VTRETEAWFDIGTPQSYLDAVDWYLDGDCYVHPDAELVDTALGENVQIMAGARLEDATVEESVIFPDATITDGQVRRSIVDEDTHVESLDLSGAVIGAHTKLNGGSR